VAGGAFWSDHKYRKAIRPGPEALVEPFFPSAHLS
jgi:hypothetical protein